MSEILKTNEILSKGYGVSPKLVMIDENLTIEAKAIYAYLSSFCGSGNTAFPTIELITSHLKISTERFYKHFNLLIKQGYITKEQSRKKNGTFTNNTYILNTVVTVIEEVEETEIIDEDKNEIEPNEEIAEEVKPVSEKTKYGKSVFGKSAYGKPKTNNNSINNNNLNNIYKDRQTNNISNTICKENDMSVNKNKIYEKVDDLLNGLVGSKDISKIQKLLEDGYSDELLCYTLDLAKEIKKDCNNSEIYRYLIGIWNNLKINNIKTLSDFKENEKQREVKRYESNRFCNAVTVRTGENKENKYAYLDSI